MSSATFTYPHPQKLLRAREGRHLNWTVVAMLAADLALWTAALGALFLIL